MRTRATFTVRCHFGQGRLHQWARYAWPWLGIALLLTCAPGSGRAQPAVDEPAAAQPLAEAIVVEPEGTCVTRARLVARIGALLRSVYVAPTLHVAVSPGPDGLSFRLLRGERESARRRFEVLPGACDARIAAVGLAIALAIDHTLLERLSAGPTDPAAGEITASDAPAAAPRGPQSSADLPDPGQPPALEVGEPSPDSSGWQVGLELGATAWLATLPHVAFGGRATVEVRTDAVSIRVGGFGAGALAAELGAGHFESQLIGGSAGACLTWREAPIALGGCAEALAALFRASGTGFTTNLSLDAPWVGLSLEAFLAFIPAPEVAVRLGASGVLAVVRPSVAVEDEEGGRLASSDVPIGGIVPSLALVVWL